MEKLLIDGNNFIKAAPQFASIADFDSARLLLVQQAASYAQWKEVSVTVVFDGEGSPDMFALAADRLHSHCKVLFSGHSATADSVIEGIVYRAKNKTHYTVISNDRRLKGFVRGLGALANSVDSCVQDFNHMHKEISARIHQRHDSSTFGQRIDL